MSAISEKMKVLAALERRREWLAKRMDRLDERIGELMSARVSVEEDMAATEDKYAALLASQDGR